jgi:hypothetical protein
MARRKPPIGRLAFPGFNPRFPNQLRNLGSVCSAAQQGFVAVARVFRRGDFSSNWQANPRPGQTGTSYNFGVTERARTEAPCGTSTTPFDLLIQTGGVEGHLVATLICARRSREAAFDHQPNFSANWISLPGVVVEVSTPAVGSGAPVASNMSV